MKKILPIAIVGILIISGLGAVVTGYTSSDVNSGKQTNIISMTFSPITIKDNSNEYVELCFNDETSYFMDPGQPMLPTVVKVVELPFGAQNVHVNVLTKGISEYEIEKEIRPSPTPLPLTSWA